MICVKDNLLKSMVFNWEGKIDAELEVVQKVVRISELACMLLVWVSKLLEDVLYVHAKKYLKGQRILIAFDLTKSDPLLELNVNCRQDLPMNDAFLNDDFSELWFVINLVKIRGLEDKFYSWVVFQD